MAYGPLHRPPVQFPVLRSVPSQCRPPFSGAGLSQTRRRWWRQSALQVDQDDHVDHAPSTADKDISPFSVKLILSSCFWNYLMVTILRDKLWCTTTSADVTSRGPKIVRFVNDVGVHGLRFSVLQQLDLINFITWSKALQLNNKPNDAQILEKKPSAEILFSHRWRADRRRDGSLFLHE